MEQLPDDEKFIKPEDLVNLEKEKVAPMKYVGIPTNSDELLRSQAHFIDLSGKEILRSH